MNCRLILSLILSLFVVAGYAMEGDGDTYVITSSEPGEIASATYALNDSYNKIAIVGPVNAADLKAVNKLVLKYPIVELHLEGCQVLEKIIPHSAFSSPQAENSAKSKLERVWIPEGVEKIDTCAFYDCPNLYEVHLPASLLFIEKYAFYGFCASEMVIPENVRDIRTTALYGTTPMNKIYMKGHNPPTITGNLVIGGWGLDVFPMNLTDLNVPIYIPKGSFIEYYWGIPWEQFTNYIEIEPEDFPAAGIACPVNDYGTVAIRSISPGEIQINGNGGLYQIFSLQGAMVNSGEYVDSATIECTPGLYVVRVGNKVEKILVK